jgi:hypothetical protein
VVGIANKHRSFMAFPTLDAAAVPPNAPMTSRTIMLDFWYKLIRFEPSIIYGDVGVGAGAAIVVVA